MDSGPQTAPRPSRAWRILAPDRQTAPVVFASPHSGRDYPCEFVAASRLGELDLRRSEDAFMDEVFAAAPEWGAPLLCAEFPRAYVDANREAFELDPDMFQGALPDYVNTASPRITAGLGTIARVVTDGEDIYHAPLCFEDALRRIETCHYPYHEALKGLIDTTRETFGGCLVVDCHSMPSSAAPRLKRGGKPVDVVLGDCFGTACAAQVTDTVQTVLQSVGLSVTRNKPYAGGFTTRHYGRPVDGVHVLQIEINRGLYMDEKRIRRGAGMAELIRCVTLLVGRLAEIDPAALKPA
ncbi:MAG: N-formylglutamate amidohydrolase [Alphaproteobacteria bacterium]|nr:N-formylglutamate amidohydrolase [Alphaproteobacteria bacterium]